MSAIDVLSQNEAVVAAALPRILDFSELGEFLDRPVKTYSTGMTMRLAFSIATQVDPQVLIVDEALSVGDGYFQKKCMDRLLAFIRGGVVLIGRVVGPQNSEDDERDEPPSPEGMANHQPT